MIEHRVPATDHEVGAGILNSPSHLMEGPCVQEDGRAPSFRAVLNWHPRARECLKQATRKREQLSASYCDELHLFQVPATGFELPSVSCESQFSRLELRHQRPSVRRHRSIEHAIRARWSIRPKRATMWQSKWMRGTPPDEPLMLQCHCGSGVKSDCYLREVLLK
jgi:hypothetical protein